MSDREDDEVELDIAASFGAEADASTQAFAIEMRRGDRRLQATGESPPAVGEQEVWTNCPAVIEYDAWTAVTPRTPAPSSR